MFGERCPMAEFLPIAVVSSDFECLEMAHGSGVPELPGAFEATLKLAAGRTRITC